jgi:hypothetical protein
MKKTCSDQAIAEDQYSGELYGRALRLILWGANADKGCYHYDEIAGIAAEALNGSDQLIRHYEQEQIDHMKALKDLENET